MIEKNLSPQYIKAVPYTFLSNANCVAKWSMWSWQETALVNQVDLDAIAKYLQTHAVAIAI